jgi:CxxC motif-containing protein (DUF1111 family)
METMLLFLAVALSTPQAAVITDIATGQRRIGRFGWKAQIATLLTFSDDAYTNEMGITNDLFPVEPHGGISEARMQECDRVKNPEDLVDLRTGMRAIDNFEAFMNSWRRSLAGRSPTRRGPASRCSAPSVVRRVTCPCCRPAPTPPPR